MAQIHNTRIVQECASVQRLDVLHTSGQGYHVKKLNAYIQMQHNELEQIHNAIPSQPINNKNVCQLLFSIIVIAEYFI